MPEGEVGGGDSRSPDDIDLIIRGMVGFAKRIRSEARFLHSEVSYVDFTLLFVLNETPGLRAVDLAEAVSIDKSTASRQLASLERRGLIRRDADPASPRSRSLRLTDRAQEVLADTDREWRRRIAERTADWPVEDVRAFATLIDRYMATELPGDAPDPGSAEAE
ncbi:MarR family winged helix-turn-helix transcriptional regulator [Tsukamurella strandjordii]|uniref:MarR family winged helix-turn-helix transcriptional regulator n=1 Tax=Tsukamurella strandjordii TaxID=147577 RepID=A0AA90SIE1_9ACTN|nr:MarR family winged helix-turn-helix transcriptional regulator [Tsukamurella strandjordii]MDP0399954.1 MarR family winged helix-turn-helix transcriptional regulator [Tsukamurella strandjordii]